MLHTPPNKRNLTRHLSRSNSKDSPNGLRSSAANLKNN